MGCTTSRQARNDLRRCPSPLALPRCRSFPARCASDAGVHVVRLTSTTLGSLEVDKGGPRATEVAAPRAPPMRMVPRTPTMTPPNEPEAIDAWALMAGLEEHSPLLVPPFARHSFSFPITAVSPELAAASCKVTPLPLAMPATHAAAAKGCEEEERKSAPVRPRKAVLYFTSLRGVRATHEDCCLARAILRGYGVRVDERDVSMHRGFRDELNGLLGLGRGALAKCWAPAAPVLPSLFVDGELVGNADEVKRLHEAGELAARLAGCESAAPGEAAGACEACADVRFVLCEACSGSCKVYVDDDDHQEEDDENPLDGGGGGGFRRCTECNENGIVRCPVCCCC
uniref:Glutaredoxin domain-containing protein n=1 Tax=Oryza punctata TaxID=4537 RepID=A0A0E0K9C5_ORYPU